MFSLEVCKEYLALQDYHKYIICEIDGGRQKDGQTERQADRQTDIQIFYRGAPLIKKKLKATSLIPSGNRSLNPCWLDFGQNTGKR